MITTAQVKDAMSKPMVSSTGDRLGEVGQIYYDDLNHRPVFATVATGVLMKKEHAVPLAEAMLSGNELKVPYDKDTVKQAPEIDVEAGHISQAEADELYRYYGLPTAGTDRSWDDATGSIPGQANTGDTMTRSEERLDVRTQTEERGRVRLRKYVVTENVTEDVPVSHEEVRVVREPLTAADRSRDPRGTTIGEEEQEVVLHEERPIVQKTSVPVERVRLETERVQDTEQVSGQVRKEQIEIDGPEEAKGRRPRI